MAPATIDPPASTRTRRRWSFGHILSGVAALAGIVGGAIAVAEYVGARPANDLTGEWYVVNTIETTTFRPFEGLKLGYRLFVRQNGVEFEARGEKWSENGIATPSSQHTPITVAGRIDGNKVTAVFQERGARRETSGTFELTIATDGNAMTGRFTSTAADARGTSTLQRGTSAISNQR